MSNLSVALDRRDFEIDPGGSVSGTATVAYHSTEPAEVRLSVTGPAAAWAFVVPPEVTVGPGAEAVVRFGFSVPRGPEPPAGPLAFQVRAEPLGGAGHPATAEGVLRVSPFSELILTMGPARAGDGGSVQHRLVVANDGNHSVRAAVAGSSTDAGLRIEVDRPLVVLAAAGREEVFVILRPLASRGRARPELSFVVSATPGGGEPVTVEGTVVAVVPPRSRLPAVTAAVVAVVLAGVLLRLTVLAPGDGGNGVSTVSIPTAAGIDDAGTEDPDCLAAGHRNLRVTGLTPAEIPLLPADFAFFNLRDDGCTPVRWNPCEPVHYVINPASAPTSGVADVREAFARISAATGITYVDDGLTDEEGSRRRARYQPERYGERWAPILVYWRSGQQETEDIEIVGGGFPTRVGDVYVTGVLFLNAEAVTDFTTRTPLQGGFGPDPEGLGPIGPAGVTWGRVILHELGHLMGMAHVRDPAQLMYPETTDHTTRPTMFAAGDLAGLQQVGAAAGCLSTPPPAVAAG